MKSLFYTAALAMSATAATADSGMFGDVDFVDYVVGYAASSDMPHDGWLVGAANLGFSNGKWHYTVGGYGWTAGGDSSAMLNGSVGYQITPAFVLRANGEIWGNSWSSTSDTFYSFAAEYETGNFGVGLEYHPEQPGFWDLGKLYGTYDLGNGNAINAISFFSSEPSNTYMTYVGLSHWEGAYGYTGYVGFNAASEVFAAVAMNRQLTDRLDASVRLTGWNSGDYANIRAGVDYSLENGNRVQFRYGQDLVGALSSYVELNYVHTFGDKRSLAQRVTQNMDGLYDPLLSQFAF